MLNAAYKDNGFTLIELVVVVILLGILSVYAASRYIGASSFSALAAQEQAISIIRQVQLGRMQSNTNASSPDAEYRLLVTSSCLGSMASCSASSDSRSNNLVLPSELSFESGMTVDFDLLGAPTSGSVRIVIQSSTDSQGVCINGEGFVYGC